MITVAGQKRLLSDLPASIKADPLTYEYARLV